MHAILMTQKRGGITSIVLSGAGTAAANGTYAPSGTINGQTLYQIGVTTVYIYYATAITYGVGWKQGVSFSARPNYSLAGTTTTGPQSPATSGSGSNPVPTVVVNY